MIHVCVFLLFRVARILCFLSINSQNKTACKDEITTYITPVVKALINYNCDTRCHRMLSLINFPEDLIKECVIICNVKANDNFAKYVDEVGQRNGSEQIPAFFQSKEMDPSPERDWESVATNLEKLAPFARASNVTICVKECRALKQKSSMAEANTCIGKCGTMFLELSAKPQNPAKAGKRIKRSISALKLVDALTLSKF